MNVNKIIFKNALLIYLGVVIYFLVMKALGFDNVSELRFLNFIFVLWGINNALKSNINLNHDNSYINNFSVGFATSVIGVSLIILGLMIYISFIDSSFITVLENSAFWGKDLNLSMVVFALAIEGIASSIVCSFILMQYYKNYKVSENVTEKIV